jgi:N-acetylmuramoyl-L-alanine amidase
LAPFRACRAIAAGIAKVLGIPVRREQGLFITGGFGFLNATNMPAAIIEVAFLDNATDRRAIRKKDALEDVGEAIAAARCDFLGVTGKPPDKHKRDVPIATNRPTASKRRAHGWADSKGCAEVFHKIIDAGWGQAKDLGIDAAVFVAHAAKETGFGKFGGVIDASFHNSAGLKIAAGGDDNDPGAAPAF